MIQATITGRLGANPERKSTSSGHEFVAFTVASKGRTGEPTWVRCSVWRAKLIDFLEKNARKGARVCISGSMELKKWGDGGDQFALDLDCTAVELYDWPDFAREEIDNAASKAIGEALKDPYKPAQNAKIRAAQAKHRQDKAQLNTDRAKVAKIDEGMPF